MDSSPVQTFTLKDRLKLFFSNRTNVLLTVGLFILLILVIFGVMMILGRNSGGPLQEVELSFDPEGPYALLAPRRDGNAINLEITRVSAYDAISYELAYQSQNEVGEAIDRGVTGSIETKQKKSDYTQEILFGTCSRGNTMDVAHCVFDKNVENGTLTLKIQKDRILYKMVTTWHFQKPDVALGIITSADGHLKYVVQGASASATPAPSPTVAPKTAKKATASATPSFSAGGAFSDDLRQKLSLVGFTLVNDLSGVPKLPRDKGVVGKVYALNIPEGRDFLPGAVTVELADNPNDSAKIGYFKVGGSDWQLLDTQAEGSTLKAEAPGAGIFAVLVDAQNPK